VSASRDTTVLTHQLQMFRLVGLARRHRRDPERIDGAPYGECETMGNGNVIGANNRSSSWGWQNSLQIGAPNAIFFTSISTSPHWIVTRAFDGS